MGNLILDGVCFCLCTAVIAICVLLLLLGELRVYLTFKKAEWLDEAALEAVDIRRFHPFYAILIIASIFVLLMNFDFEKWLS